MANIFSDKALVIIISCIILIFKALYAFVIYHKCEWTNKKTRNVLTYLSFPFPIITGIICISKQKKYGKTISTILIAVTTYIIGIILVSLAAIYSVSFISAVNNHEKHYDKDGTFHIYAFDVIFTDTDNNQYTFDFDKSGYDYLYINSTEERLNADYCYINSEGYLYYDDDMSITAVSEDYCVDTDGSVYYPSKYTTFHKDGTINYHFNSANFDYDRFANAYVTDYVPYYDENGNKYLYSFDSNTQDGVYTSVTTGEAFDNEYSFVDGNGYFVYDKNHDFIRQENIKNVRAYKDSSGKTYYWASCITWNKNGQLLDSYGEVIK